MQERKTCRLCVIACVALIFVVAGLFAMPFLPDIDAQEEVVAPPLPSFIHVHATVVDPATIGSLDRAEMTLPEE